MAAFFNLLPKKPYQAKRRFLMELKATQEMPKGPPKAIESKFPKFRSELTMK